MNEDRLRELLRQAPVPDEAEAERRGLRVARAAFAQRQPEPRAALPRLAVALAALTLFAALALSPAGAAVRDWVGDVFATGVPDAEPALTEIPGGGRLLIQSASGPWVVQPDGSRRLLGRYDEATWSPRGLFVGTAQGRTLSAVEPDGSLRWSLSAEAPVSDPRWSSSGFRIAYRAGLALRLVAADGTGDALVDPRVAPVPPAWSPLGLDLLAFVDTGGTLRIVDAEDRQPLGSSPALAAANVLSWAADGSMLLEVSPRALRLHPVTASKLAGRLDLGSPRQLPLPAGATVAAAAFSPRGQTIAALLELPGGERRAPRSEVVLIDAGGGPPRRLFATPGRLSGLTWSPDGRRLLIGWRDADQWLFVPVDGGGRIRAVGGISAAFAPGEAGSATFPQVVGWCCAAPAP